jgi:hypothetical protein
MPLPMAFFLTTPYCGTILGLIKVNRLRIGGIQIVKATGHILWSKLPHREMKS